MGKRKNTITIYEHQVLRTDRGIDRLSPDELTSLQTFHGEKGVPYYNLIYNGVRFNEHVGVIQVGRTVIEVLPKADKSKDSTKWRELLIGMLQSVGLFKIHAPSSSNLSLKTNSILDLYFELFIKELESILHRGLIKKYRKVVSNQTALKGSIQFAQHINKNLIHKERFFVKHSTYDQQHGLHAILYKALKLLKFINVNTALNSRIGSLLLDFPEQTDIKVSSTTFDKIAYNRKTAPYKDAIEIARLILLNYHPDLSKGNNNVLALMFNMNLLWEQFVYVSLRKYKPAGVTVTAQNSKNFWKPENGYRSKIRPDIVINKGKPTCVVIDTKWKNLNGKNPSPDDLRQLFVYLKYYGARKVALVYPGDETKCQSGRYYPHSGDINIESSAEECSVITLAVEDNISEWQEKICEELIKQSI